MHDPVTATAGALWFVFRGSELLLSTAGELPGGDVAARLAGGRVQSVGEYCGRRCYGAALAAEITAAPPPDGHVFVHLKKLLDRLPEALCHLAGRALEILEWERGHRFCGACGAPTEQPSAAIVRKCGNPACGREHYPRISPVVIMAVERGPEILLGRSPHFVPGMYSTLAGFVDAGESAEAAVRREIFEESGLEIAHPRYFASQPWPFPHSLMLGFQADYAGGEIRIAADELEDAAFFHVDALPAVLPGPSTIAHWLIRDFCRRHGRGFPAAS